MNYKLRLALLSAVSSLTVASTPTISPFFTFRNVPTGAGPNGSLILASDGNFYGTTSAGGNDGNGCFTNHTNCAGAIYRITPQGQFTLLHTFSDLDTTNGETPLAGVVEGPDGFLYGTTSDGGFRLRAGTIFKIDKNGANFQTVHQFCSASGCPNGSAPAAALIVASDGNFYGTTTEGPGLATGSIFRMTPGGAVSLVALFNGNNNVVGIPGTNTSIQGLVQASDGSLYGVTGVNTFRITLNGAFTILHTFDYASEGIGSASLIQANDGNLYGMTDIRSVSVGGGVLFRIGLDGTYQNLTGINGATIGFHPQTLLQASDGNLWGFTTNFAAANGGGAVFSVTLAGTFLQSTFLTRSTGLVPTGGLTQAPDGRLFGTAALGGVNAMGNSIDGGTIFVVDAGIPAALQSIVIGAASTSLSTGTSEQFSATGNYADGRTADLTSSVTWHSSNSSIATISASGFATANSPGTTNISATQNGVTSNIVALTATAATPKLTSISITAASNTIAAGSVLQFSATGFYSNGSSQDITSLVIWSSSNPSAAVIGAATGLASGLAVGSTNISARLANVTSNVFALGVTAMAAPAITAFRVLFGTQAYLVSGPSRVRLPWQVNGIQVVFSQPIASGTAASLGGVAPKLCT